MAIEMDHHEKLRLGIETLRKIQNDLIELEVLLQMELMGTPADSGFTETVDDIRERWTFFSELLDVD